MSTTNLKTDSKRQRSPRAPVIDLEAALALAAKIYRTEGGAATPEAFAGLSGNSARSSRISLRISALRSYGLVEAQAGQLVLTPLAKSILTASSPEEEKNGKLRAFLNVPIFRRMAEDFRGKALSDQAMIANHIHRQFRISQRNAPGWARAFLRSGDMARFFSIVDGQRAIPEHFESPMPYAGILPVRNVAHGGAAESGKQVKAERPEKPAAEDWYDIKMGLIRFLAPRNISTELKQDLDAFHAWFKAAYGVS